MANQTILLGDRVSFNGRGRNVEGVVVRFRTKTRRKVLDLARRCGIPESESMAHQRVAEIQTDSGLWTVRVDVLKRLGSAGTKNFVAAERAAADLKNKIAARKSDRRSANSSAAYDAGIYDWNNGDFIEINYSDIGWQQVVFLGINSGGRVKFRDRYGRERACSPTIVRKPQPKTN
jgi:hypothetical protein